jgi:hypothetical protein
MGLDVYLYHCRDRRAAKALEEQYSAQTDDLWKKHCDTGDDWSKLAKNEQDRRYAEYTAAAAAVAKDLGLNDDGKHPNVVNIEEPSGKHPEHYFKVGYFRSSYNDGGINNVLRRLGLQDLYHIMGAGDDYEFTPDWSASRQRAADILAQLRSAARSDIDVMEVSANIFADPNALPKSAAEARRIVLETLQRFPSREDGGFSNSQGEFYPSGMQVVAMIPGLRDGFEKTLYGKPMPCTFIAYRRDGGTEWYEKALEIVIETCDFVLQKPDPQNYYVHWSA